MSYDISFKVKVDGCDYYAEIGECYANTTWNVREMIVQSTGLEWNNSANNGFVKDIIPHIQKGYVELKNHPEKYRKYEAQNGWGTVESTRDFFDEILNAWELLKLSVPKEIVEIVTFWIE